MTARKDSRPAAPAAPAASAAPDEHGTPGLPAVPDGASVMETRALPPTIVAAAAAAGAVAAAAVAQGHSMEQVAEEAGEAAAEAVAGAMKESEASAAKLGTPDRRQRRIATKRARRALKAQHAAKRTTIQVLADRLTSAASSSGFLIFHVVWFVVWLPWNAGAFRPLGLQPFDPYPFGFLTMVVSLEAIFLSIFVLMSQARESAIAELREEISLEVIFRMEEEVTKTLQLVSGLFSRLGYRMGEDAELRRMLEPLDADSIEKDLIEQLRSVNEEAARPRARGARGDARKKKPAPRASKVPDGHLQAPNDRGDGRDQRSM